MEPSLIATIPLTDTELQELTTPRLNIKDHTLDDNHLVQNCPLDNGRHTLEPRFDLARLDGIPPELLHLVLCQLDLQSLTDFRRVNQRAMTLVDSFPEYRVVVEHAPNAIRGMLSIQSARFNTLLDLNDKLCTAECDVCGDFGGYLYLIVCRRVCFLCSRTESSFLPLLKSDILRKFALESQHLHSIPRIRSRPGRYSPNSNLCRRAITLFDHRLARKKGILVHGTEEIMTDIVRRRDQKRLSEYSDKRSRYESTGRIGRAPRLPRVTDAFDTQHGKPDRFMALISAPYFDVHAKAAIDGLYCVGCRKETHGPDGDWRPDRHWRKLFTTETFASHMVRWGQIVNGFHCNSSITRP